MSVYGMIEETPARAQSPLITEAYVNMLFRDLNSNIFFHTSNQAFLFIYLFIEFALTSKVYFYIDI